MNQRISSRPFKDVLILFFTTIDWLEKMGVDFLDVGCHNPGFPFTWHIVKSLNRDDERPGLAGAAMRVMTERAKKLGVKFYFRTPVKKLVRKGRSIEGVIAEDESGETIQATARAIVLATGGFGDNPSMIKKYTGFEVGKTLFSTRIPGATGDGMRMAWEIGRIFPGSVGTLGGLKTNHRM